MHNLYANYDCYNTYVNYVEFMYSKSTICALCWLCLLYVDCVFYHVYVYYVPILLPIATSIEQTLHDVCTSSHVYYVYEGHIPNMHNASIIRNQPSYV
jgi:hypothetical protein